MSPLTLRRYRAERLLRQQFEGLRKSVIAAVGGRLRASGVSLDQSDLDACYAVAWNGLYAALLDGQEIANPAGWLVLVTYRRAIEEHRARMRIDRAAEHHSGCEEPDFAAELDDRIRLRQLFEALRSNLSTRELQAASLCYLQGLSRAEAATQMGVSDGRMRKLMEGRDAGRAGVAGKMGALVETIREEAWCEEQGSLMRGLAFGILAPDGERHRLALMHRSECSACRAYVVSLRGLAAALPPVLLPWGTGAGQVLARACEGAHVGAGIARGKGAAGSGGAGGAHGGGLAVATQASGAAGAGGAAGGSWLLAGGPLGAKFAVGCALALGVGAGCVALSPGHARTPAHRPSAARLAKALPAPVSPAVPVSPGESATGASQPGLPAPAPAAQARPSAILSASSRATREFGPEQTVGASPARSFASTVSRPAARSASAVTASEGAQFLAPSAAAAPPPNASGQALSSSGSRGGETAAQREFAPG